MSPRFIIFLGVILSLLLLMHWAVFGSVIRFFEINRPGVRRLLYAAMVFLAFSFIAGFFLVHWRENGWTVGYYKFAATWTGFLFHFLAAVILAWVIIGLAALAGYPVNRQVVAGLVLAVAAGYGVYGIWNAFHPRVREITVTIKNLPTAWHDKKLVQISDIHLGNIHGKRFTESLVSRINSLEPDLVLITGDLFDGMGGPFETFIEPLNRMRGGKGIFIITGNHEHYIGIEQTRQLFGQLRFRFLKNEMVDVDGLEIVGVGYPGIESLTDISGLPERKSPDKSRILLFHTPTNMQLKGGNHVDRHFSTYWMPDTSFELNRKLDADLQLSGHTHHGQIFPFPLLTRYLYQGHDYGFSRSGNLLIYTTCGAGTWGPPMRTAMRPEIVLIRLKAG